MLLTPLTASAVADVTYTVSGGEATVTGCSSNPCRATVVIPNSLGGYPVTTIGSSAFANKTMTTVQIADSVRTIQSTAFYGASNLATVSIGRGVTTIGNNAFQDTALTSVDLPASLSNFGSRVFMYVDGLESITIDAANTTYASVDGVVFDKAQTTLLAYPNGKPGATYVFPSTVTAIAEAAFIGNQFLRTVVIPDQVTSLGSAFSASHLTSVDVGNGVTQVSGFGTNPSLTSVRLGNAVTAIGPYAFYQDDLLPSIVIPSGVQTLDMYAFAYDSQLTTATFLGNAPPSVGANPFYGTHASFVIRRFAGTTGWPDVPGTFADKPTELIRFPAAPAAPTVVAGISSMSVTVVPAKIGEPATAYHVVASPGGASCTATAPETTCAIAPLDHDTAYVFTATATNAAGDSYPSNPSTASTLLALPAITNPTIRISAPVRQHVTKSSISLSAEVELPAAGTVTMAATTKRNVRAKRITRCSTTVLISKAETRTLICRIDQAGRAQLRRSAMWFSQAITFTPTGGTPSTVIRRVVLPHQA